MPLNIIPMTFNSANEYVKANHRHHGTVTGCKFCIGVINDSGILCGVAICGRPVSRYLDDGFTLEVNRLCTDGTKNACSKLYSACVKIARDMGYHKVITYILASEDGASLKASNFKDDGIAGGAIWTGERKKDKGVPKEMKRRFVFQIS